MKDTEPTTEDQTFAEFRRKIKQAELLSAAMENILHS